MKTNKKDINDKKQLCAACGLFREIEVRIDERENKNLKEIIKTRI
jgi:ribosomal protein L37E